MRFFVRHQTVYRYSAQVKLAPHLLRFAPRPDAGRLIERDLAIEPEPRRREETLDGFGNLVTRVEFDGPSDAFRIESRFVIDLALAPADARAEAPALPWPRADGEATADYLATGEIDGAVRAFASELATASGGEPLAFLDRLNHTLFTEIRHDIRPEGAARPPEETLRLGHGACRDLTNLFLAACRSLGMPARFVSGYQAHADTPDGRRHLHAWPEAFVSGLGWRSYDPTHGLAVADGHVALAAAPDQAGTMPVEGGFYGDGASSTLTYQVEIATSGG